MQRIIYGMLMLALFNLFMTNTVYSQPSAPADSNAKKDTSAARTTAKAPSGRVSQEKEFEDVIKEYTMISGLFDNINHIIKLPVLSRLVCIKRPFHCILPPVKQFLMQSNKIEQKHNI